MIRAKFRCMERTEHRHNKTSFKFLPVIGRGDASDEDKSFWEATPGGEAYLSFQHANKRFEGEGRPVQDFKPGDYFYIDMVPGGDEAHWMMKEKSDNGDSGTAKFHFWQKFELHEPGQEYSTLELHIDNRRAFKMLGEPKAPWTITFSFAEKSDD